MIASMKRTRSFTYIATKSCRRWSWNMSSFQKTTCI